MQSRIDLLSDGAFLTLDAQVETINRRQTGQNASTRHVCPRSVDASRPSEVAPLQLVGIVDGGGASISKKHSIGTGFAGATNSWRRLARPESRISTRSPCMGALD